MLSCHTVVSLSVQLLIRLLVMCDDANGWPFSDDNFRAEVLASQFRRTGEAKRLAVSQQKCVCLRSDVCVHCTLV